MSKKTAKILHTYIKNPPPKKETNLESKNKQNNNRHTVEMME